MKISDSFIPEIGKNHVWENDSVFKNTCKRLKHFNINFIEGESSVEIPEIFNKNNNFVGHSVLLFIDGPKEDEQLKLLHNLFNKYSNCSAAGHRGRDLPHS